MTSAWYSIVGMGSRYCMLYSVPDLCIWWSTYFDQRKEIKSNAIVFFKLAWANSRLWPPVSETKIDVTIPNTSQAKILLHLPFLGFFLRLFLFSLPISC